ncbi:hypothetical protein CE91St62_18420 [Lachnospiraceae bacterium]|uniref:recombinase family protein n=1 Tax=Extibacter sp. GGCC_0201 TaxID=2731209 RepID=UPI001AA13443|nr:recombinase family protein [Extibacter sp. GGCC_0201]MBO1719726.1 recombinase family protein [Extibacter sp. GGCC_0201]BDF33776.1 hypothetical protein CE91St61_18510 [Lachnospiraceae bacterium]BDF37781.1 hypothetical protein CE91St62_18420 [Lachnospiraceae bacterium]
MIRTVIYCRCSTEEESQQEALKKQVAEAKESVKANGWMLVDEYIESKSGTTAEKRKEYQRLYEDLQTDRFDVVLIKSQDRLMRNTKDWYLFIDRLVTNGKKLYMYMERKFYTTDDALITGIKAILAEEYSKDLSKKINNAHRNRQKRGESFILPPGTYGYEKLPDKSIVIVEEEAKVIQLMFHLCQSMGCGRIAAVLADEGYRDRKGQLFQEETVRRIIRNPIRCGTVVQNKRHFDFQLKQELRMPEEEWIVHKCAVPAIVSEDTWQSANEAMDERAARYRTKAPRAKPAEGKFHLSGKIHCGLCGGTYYRTIRKRFKNQEKIIEWKCRNYLRFGRKDNVKDGRGTRKAPIIDGAGCDNIHLEEQKLLVLLEAACEAYYNNYGIDYPQICDKAISVLEKVFIQREPAGKAKELKKRIQRQENLNHKLVDKLLDGIISDEDYKRKKTEFEERLHNLREELKACRWTEPVHTGNQERIRKIEERLKGDLLHRVVLSEMLDSIECIEVYEDRLKIRFYHEEMLEIPLDMEFAYASRKESERERIVAYMRENPSVTAKEIAEMEHVSLTTVNYRIKKLRQQGRIYFDGRGGRGQWAVCEREVGT